MFLMTLVLENGHIWMAQNHETRYTLRLYHTFASFVQKNEKSMPEGMLKVSRFAPKADRGGPELINFNILLVSW